MIDEFNERGYVVLKDKLSTPVLGYMEYAISQIFNMQASKIAEYRERLGFQSISPAKRLCETLSLLEAHDKEALYQVQKMLPHVPQIRDVFTPRFWCMFDRLLPGALRLISGPALFVNAPNTQQLLYKWHTEAHHYPDRRRFVNVWFPVFGDRTKANGAMSVKVGSHKREYPRPAPYQGYNKDTEGKANHFIQLEVPENFHDDFEEVVCETQHGDVVLFDRNLIHRSNHNTTDDYAFACVARVWTPIDDLTLAGDIRGEPIGRAGLMVTP